MKLRFDKDQGRNQPDPFVFEDAGRYYLYVTAEEGVEAYSAESPFAPWHWEGIVCAVPGAYSYWAPCIIRTGGRYYLYFSCQGEDFFQYLHVAWAASPLGPFSQAVRLFDRFSIDAHVVETGAGLFLWYAQDNLQSDKIGTRVYVDRLLDPVTPARQPREAITPDFDEELFRRNRNGDGRDWYTIEGPFWFTHEGWQYVMYSGGCFENDTYHVGYAAARTEQQDLTKVLYGKHTDHGAFSPVLRSNDFEEGTGHHSVVRYGGEFYAVYHGRDLRPAQGGAYEERRTARICKLTVRDGIITARRYPDRV